MSELTNDEAARALIPGVELMLRKGISEATEAVIASAVKDFEAELRRKIGEAAIDVSRFYEVSMQRDSLVITIRDYKTSAPKAQ
jgi:hypothetical protein